MEQMCRIKTGDQVTLGEWLVLSPMVCQRSADRVQVEGLFLAVGMNGAQAQSAGGVGRALALWLCDGAPRAYLLPCDCRRFLDLHNNAKFLRERVTEAVGRTCLEPHPLQVSRSPLLPHHSQLVFRF